MKGIGRILIFLGISVVLVVLYILLMHRNSSKEIKDLRLEYSTVSDSLSKARQIANRLPETQRQYAFLEKQWVYAQGMLPTERETEHLLSIISKAATENNIKITSFKPGALTTKQNFQEYPLKITVLGKYHSTGKFFNDLGKLKRIIRIGDIKMQYKKEDKVIETTFTATSYVYAGLRDEGTKKGKQGAQK